MALSFRPRFSLPEATIFALVLGVAGLSCVVNQPLFVGSFYGWCACGALVVAALLAAAWRADSRAIVPAVLAAVVLASPYALPYSFGVLLFAAAFILARSLHGDAASRVGRFAACVAGLWCAYVIVRWCFDAVVPALAARETSNRLAGETWLTDTPWPRMLMPLGHANYTSGVGVILLPVFVGLALWKKERPAWRALWAFFALLAFALIPGGGSRAGFLAPPVAFAAWVLLAPASMISLKRKIGFVAAGAFATGAAVMFHPHFREWISNPDAISYSDLVRRDYVEGCWTMFLEKPLTGWGAGALPANFSPFNPPGAEHVSCYHAHTTPVQWLVEFGPAGVLLYAAIAALCLVALGRVSRRADEAMPVMTGLVVAASGYTLFALFDYQTNIPAPGALWGAVLGCVAAGTLRSGESRSGFWIQKISRPTLLVAAGYAALLVLSEAPARREVFLAKATLGADLAGAARHMADAADSAPGLAAIHGYAAVVYDRFASAKNSSGAAGLADREWERATLAAPNFPQLKTYRALHLSPTDPRKAVALFKESLRDGPKFPAAWRGLAEAYFRLNDRDSVASVIALSLFVRPENAFDPALRSGAFGVEAEEVRRRFDDLVAGYAREFPGDRFALRELAVVQKQIHAWYAAGGPMDFARANPTRSENPVRRLLAKRLPLSGDERFDRPAAIRALTAAVFVSQDYTLDESQAGVLLDRYLGKPGAPFAGVRTVMTPESTLHFGSYLGVSDLAEIGFPSYAREDLLANLFLYDAGPPRIRADKRFLLNRLAKLP